MSNIFKVKIIHRKNIVYIALLIMLILCIGFFKDFAIKQYIKLNTPLGCTGDEVRQFITKNEYRIRYDRDVPFDRLGSSRISLGQSHIWVEAYSYKLIFHNNVQIVWIFQENNLIDIIVWTYVDAL